MTESELDASQNAQSSSSVTAKFDTVYFYSMARFRVCSVCGSTSFKRVLVRLPSGRDRVTDFEACEKCKLVFLHPDQSPLDRLASGANHRDNVPADVIKTIVAALPDPGLGTTADGMIEYYKHPRLGQMALVFKRMRQADGGVFFWHLDDAKLLG